MPKVPILNSGESLPGFSGQAQQDPSQAGALFGQISQAGALVAADEQRRIDEVDREKEIERERLQRLSDATFVGQSLNSMAEFSAEEFNRRLREGNPADPGFADGFATAFDEERAKIERPKGMSEEAWADFNIRLDGQRTNLLIQARETQSQAAENVALGTLEGTANSLAAAADRGMPLDQVLVGLNVAVTDYRGLIDGESLDNFEENERATLIATSVQSLVDRKQFDDARAVLAEPDFNSDLTAEQRIALGNLIQAGEKSAEVEARRAQAEAAAALTAANAIAASDLEINVSRGLASYEEIETAFAEGTITPAKRTQLVKMADELASAEIERQAALTMVSEAITGAGQPLDHRNDDTRDAVDDYYTTFVTPLFDPEVTEDAITNPSDRNFVIADFVEKTGIIPETVKSEIRSAFRSGTAEDQATAADLIDRIRNGSASVALNDMAQRDFSRGIAIADLVNAGMEPADAVAHVDSVASIPAQEVEAREDRYSDEIKSDPNRDWLESNLDLGGFPVLGFGEATIDDRVVGQFDDLVEGFFMETGELDIARSIALTNIKQRWGVTDADGSNRLIEFPPELIYGVFDRGSADSEWMHEQLIAEVGALLPDEENLDERIRIVSDTLTARNVPTYGVLLQDETGRFVPVIAEDGTPLRWRPDWPSSPAAADNQAELEADLLAAEAARRDALEFERQMIEETAPTPLDPDERARIIEESPLGQIPDEVVTEP